MKQYRNFEKEINNNSIILLSVLRNERLFLKYLIEYYKNLDITHFIFIDNGSNDGSFEYLLTNSDLNCALYRTKDSYKENTFGVKWIEKLLLEKCQNCWCLVVDMDELFMMDKFDTLRELRAEMEKKNRNISFSLMVELYPRDLEKVEKYEEGENFLNHSTYYDRFNGLYHFFPSTLKSPYDYICGGMRRRVYHISPLLSKKVFFKYNFFSTYRWYSGFHCLTPKKDKISKPLRLRYYFHLNYILHFKYLRSDYKSHLVERIKLDQDWEDSSEYKAYKRHYRTVLYDPRLSRRFIKKRLFFKDFIILKRITYIHLYFRHLCLFFGKFNPILDRIIMRLIWFLYAKLFFHCIRCFIKFL